MSAHIRLLGERRHTVVGLQAEGRAHRLGQQQTVMVYQVDRLPDHSSNIRDGLPCRYRLHIIICTVWWTRRSIAAAGLAAVLGSHGGGAHPGECGQEAQAGSGRVRPHGPRRRRRTQPRRAARLPHARWVGYRQHHPANTARSMCTLWILVVPCWWKRCYDAVGSADVHTLHITQDVLTYRK
jgi:hypothetical protein